LIGGTTAFDDNAAALAAVMAEWEAPKPLAVRLANLRGTGVGMNFAQRNNGNYFLKASGPGATVFDDATVDVFSDPAGSDWFFATLAGSKKDTLNLGGRFVTVDALTPLI